jgi:hypothetical protein
LLLAKFAYIFESKTKPKNKAILGVSGTTERKTGLSDREHASQTQRPAKCPFPVGGLCCKNLLHNSLVLQ